MCGKWRPGESCGRTGSAPVPPLQLRFDFGYRDVLAVYIAHQRHLLAGVVYDLVLVRDVVDLAVRRHQHGFVAALDAALRAARVAVGRGFGALLLRATGVGDVPAKL